MISMLSRARAARTSPAVAPSADTVAAPRDRAAAPSYRPVRATHGSGASTVLTIPSVELVVSPFPTFHEVGSFHQQLASLPCVRAVHLRRIQHGALQLRVECTGSEALIEEIAEALNVPFGVISHEPHRIELLLYGNAARDVAEARGA